MNLLLRLSGNRNYRQSFGLTAGTVFNSLLGLFFYVLVARALGPDNFGRFAFLLTIGMIIAELADWGFDSAIIRFAARENFNRVLGAAFVQRTFLLSLAALLSAVLTLTIGLDFYLSVIVAISLSYLALTTQAFLAKQQYLSYVGTNIAGNVFRLVAAFLLANSGHLETNSALSIFALANVAALACGFALLWQKLHRFPINFSRFQETFQRLWSYANWMGASVAVSSLASRLDVPFVYTLAGTYASGIYAGAQKLNSFLPQVAGSLDSVFSPKFSLTDNFRQHFRDYQKITMVICLGIVVLAVLAPFVVPFVFGEKYLSSIPIFQILLIGLIPLFASGPFAAAILYRFGRSNYHLYVNSAALITSLTLFLVLIPSFRQAGAAVAAGLSNLIAFVFYVFFYLRLNGKN